MRRLAIASLSIVFGGCQTQDDAVRSQLSGFIGQPISTYMAVRARAPSGIQPLPYGGRLYIFERFGCGTSIRTDGEIIREINTTCPAGLA